MPTWRVLYLPYASKKSRARRGVALTPITTPAFWDIVDANRAPGDAELADILDAMNEPDATTLIKIGQRAAGTEIDGSRTAKTAA